MEVNGFPGFTGVTGGGVENPEGHVERSQRQATVCVKRNEIHVRNDRNKKFFFEGSMLAMVQESFHQLP